jgi:type I restriction enzyme S subunit
VTTIGELADAGVLAFGDGYRTKRSEHGAHGFRILRVGDIADGGAVSLTGPDFVSDRYANQIGPKAAESGDVILTTKGTVGRVAVMPETPEPIVYSPQICYFRVTDSDVLDPRFLRYWFESEAFWRQASHRMNNTDMAAYINLADVRSLDLDLPGRSRQRAIADVLSALDDKIAANGRVARHAESLALALASMVRTRTTVAALATPVRDTVSPETFADALVDHYSLPAFDSGRVPEVVEGRSIQSAKFAVTRPAVLISKLNPRIPRIWDVPAAGPRRALCSTEFVVLQPHDVSTALLWSVVSQPSVSSSIQGMVAGTSGSHQRVRPADLIAVEIGDPATLGSGVAAKIESLVARAHGARLERADLTELRDALLPALMSGRLRVREAQEAVDAASGSS